MDLLKIRDYFKKYPIRSVKLHRIHLLPRYFELKDLKAYQPGTYAHQA